MDTNLGAKKLLPLLLLGLLIRTTHANNVSISEELRHPRVSGRIVKLYSGVRPEPILCSGEGFQADPVDCAVFYRCVKGSNNKYTVFRYKCGPGTVYDPDTEICNHPKSTRRINCGGYTASPIESSNENEIDGSRQEITSPITTKYVVYTESATNAAASTLSTQKFWSPTEYKSTPSASNTWITTVKEHLRATRSPIPRQPSPQYDEPCTSDGFMGDSENCRKFYRCVGNGRGGYIRYEFSCSELTIWDDEAQACNHAWAVKKRRCGRGSPENENRNSEFSSTTKDNEVNSKQTIQSQLQISYGLKVNQVQTQISKGSATQNQTQINYGDRINEKISSNRKQNQTQISHGSAVSQTQTQISHGNKGSQTQLQIDHSNDASQSQTQVHETDDDQTSGSQHHEGSQSTDNAKPVDGNENDDCTESGFMGDSKDCKKFYRCVENGRGGYIKYEFSCGEGTVWDRNAEACNHAWAVKDCKNSKPSETSSQDSKTTTTTSKSTTAETVTDDDEDVGYGVQNQQSSQTTTLSQDKPLTTTETSKTTQSNDDDSSSTSASSENICTSSGFMGDSEDCKKFYRCVDNDNGGYTRYEFSCGEGTVWDSNLEACNHAWAVEKCGKETPNKNIPDTTTTVSNVTQDEENHSGSPTESDNNVDKSTESTSSSATSTTTLTSPTPSSTNNNNICTSSGFMGDENDCKKFYRCVDDGKGGYIRYEFSCGEGTVWDQSIESCNHPSKDIKCRASESATQETLNEGITPSSSNSQTSSGDTDENNQGTTELASSEGPLIGLSSVTPTNDDDSCSKEGFFGDTNNCKKFYRCVENQQGGFTKYDFTCGEGTMWDPEIDACNHESSVKKGCSTPINDATTQQQPVPGNDGHAESSTSQPSTSTTTEGTEHHQSTSNDKCESDGFFANSVNCKKFYRCVDDGKGGYTKYDFTCGDGTIWDQQSQTCNHESSQNKCTESLGTNASENAESDSGTTTQSTVSSESTTSTTKRPDNGNNDQSNSNDQCTSEGFYANSDDCKKFYRCVSNDKGAYTKYDFTCGEGTIWVQEIQACDHDNNISNCSSQGAVSTTSSSQNGPDEQPTTKASFTTSTTVKSTSESESNESNDCSNNSTVSAQSNECKSEGFHPNNKDCRKFYRCVDNGQGGYTKYDFTCGEGTAWDSNIQACNHENEVKNCHGSQEVNQAEPKPTGENSSQTIEATSTTKISTTESSGENSSQTTEATSTTKTSTTESSGENKQPTGNDKCDKEGYYGDSNDCQKFYRCVDNGNGGLTKYDFTCGDGTIWDQDIQTCNHPGDVQNPSCNKNTTSTVTTTEASSGTSSASSESSTTSSTSTLSSTTTSEAQGSSDCSQGSTQKPQNKQVNCTKAGFYADPDDCKKFYRCVDWDNNGQRFSVYHFDCGEGTIWDPELETCNHEDSVYPPRDCSGTQSQNQNTEETTTTTTTTTTTQPSTQESTTTEESTTQQSTTESTTQVATTSEQTTTEQSTTQKTTTTEKSTTQQSSTEQSTTQQSSTTEKSTTEKSTTTEQSTTEKSTTTEQSTTEKSTTTEQSTTQQSSTTEQTTEQTSTTEQSTTESSTTDQSSTTEQSTTEQSSTTQSTTTEESTTQQSTTQQDTTTTEQSTTQETTESSAEQSSTTEESTTQQSSTTEQATDSTDSSSTEQSSSSTTEQSSDGTTTEDNQESTTEGSSSGSKDCPETEDDQYLYVCPTSFRRHPRYCNMFYQCTEDNDSHDLDIAVFKCPNNTIYDESKTQCVEEDKADKKCDGEKAERRRVKRLGVNYKEPIVASKGSLVCPSTGHFPFEKSECSPAFLKCDKTKNGKLRGYVNQCPDSYVYWSISRRCEPKFKVKDCKMTSNDWTRRWEIPIERSNVAT